MSLEEALQFEAKFGTFGPATENPKDPFVEGDMTHGGYFLRRCRVCGSNMTTKSAGKKDCTPRCESRARLIQRWRVKNVKG